MNSHQRRKLRRSRQDKIQMRFTVRFNLRPESFTVEGSAVPGPSSVQLARLVDDDNPGVRFMPRSVVFQPVVLVTTPSHCPRCRGLHWLCAVCELEPGHPNCDCGIHGFIPCPDCNPGELLEDPSQSKRHTWPAKSTRRWSELLARARLLT